MIALALAFRACLKAFEKRVGGPQHLMRSEPMRGADQPIALKINKYA